MGVKLIVEVLDHAPADLTAVDRLLLVVIAEHASDRTREGFPGWELIARRMGWSGQKDGGKNAVSTALSNIAGRGVDVRVPLAHDKNGRPVYAVRGRRSIYRIPPLQWVASAPTHSEAERVATTATHEDEKGWQSRGSKGGNPGGQRVAATATPSLNEPSLNPHTPPSADSSEIPPTDAAAKNPADARQPTLFAKTEARLPEAVQIVLDGLHAADYPGATADDARAVHRAVIAKYAGRVNLTWLRTMASNRSYGPFYEEIRKARSEQVAAAVLELQRTDPPCEHDTPGGRALHPTTGLQLCSMCRRGMPARDEPHEATDPAVVGALNAYRDNAAGSLSALDLMRITQEVIALHNRQVPAQALAQLAAKAAQTNTGLLAAAVAR